MWIIVICTYEVTYFIESGELPNIETVKNVKP